MGVSAGRKLCGTARRTKQRWRITRGFPVVIPSTPEDAAGLLWDGDAL